MHVCWWWTSWLRKAEIFLKGSWHVSLVSSIPLYRQLHGNPGNSSSSTCHCSLRTAQSGPRKQSIGIVLLFGMKFFLFCAQWSSKLWMLRHVEKTRKRWYKMGRNGELFRDDLRTWRFERRLGIFTRPEMLALRWKKSLTWETWIVILKPN